MKALGLILFASCLIFACKNNEVVPNSLTGKWRLISKEVSQNDTIKWQNLPSTDSVFLFFSKYGEVVNSTGFLTQCGPASLKINGIMHRIKFHSEPANDPFAVLCAECLTWNIELQETEMILYRCSPNRMKFTRE
ncbi:hypothetical protein LXL81_29055 [Dyadobacter sp. CY356]|nr:hypothetical protein [Dyadobacter sp. CY356]